ncbi:unnamed protein product [Nezara viridula]|uniref:Cytochrome P450 n=1 Tax=Nezara viridula TaxID=85310 RepID=A0A9P0MRA5_NEZVI|nr:unnamed protein product [Nezara viridula]
MIVIWGLSCVLMVVFVRFLVKNWKPSMLPGPRGFPYFGAAFSVVGISSKDIIPLIIKWCDEYGKMFGVKMLGANYVFVSEPELVKPLLTSSINITKGRFEYSFLKLIFNDGLIVSDGEKWRSNRRLLTPSFHNKILKSSVETVGRNAEEFVSQLLASDGKPIDIEDTTHLLTLKIICETAMGVKLNTKDKQQNEYVKASRICHDTLVYRYLRFWLFPDFIFRRSDVGKRFIKSLKLIHEVADQVIKKRKELYIAEKNESKNEDSRKKERNAFLDNLLELVDSNPDLFNESNIREEVDTFLIAGHNPSAATLKFLHFILANRPDVQEKLYDEQVDIFGDSKRMTTAQDLEKMTYLKMVINETLRLYPTIPLYSRCLKEDLLIDEKTIIPAGHTVAVFTYAVHRSKKHWDNPEEFIPERFAPGIEIHPFSFLPFSAGPRNCIGQKYAMMELKIIISTLVRQCWLEPVTTSVSLDYGITLNPVEPIIVKAIPRNGTRRMIPERNS